MKLNNKFSFWCPISVQKSKDSDGKEKMIMEGIASTSDEDSDGENLQPQGFELDYFKKSGVVNWHHQTKNNPEAIIGEPIEATLKKAGLYVKTELYNDSPLARSVYKLGEVLNKNSKTRRLGYSIEGTVIERDEDNPKIIKKARITGLAITHMPKNPKTFVDIMKGNFDDEDSIEEVIDNDTEELLTKAEVFEKIFTLFPGIDNDSAINYFDKILNFTDMKTNKPTQKKGMITEDKFNKALDALGLNDSFEKGDDDDELLDDDEIIEDEDINDEEDNDDDDDVEKGDDYEIRKPSKKVIIKKGMTVKKKKGDEEDEESEEEEIDEEDKSKFKKNIKKGREVSTLDIIKAIEYGNAESDKMMKAMGTIVLDLKSQVSELQERVEEMGDEPVRKSTITKGYREKETFQKGKAENSNNSNKLSLSHNLKQVKDLLDKCTFEKGYDAEYGSALTYLEAGGGLKADVLDRIKAEKGITIVA